MLKIRLQRHGRKKYAFYHIVAADSRAPRDGKFIERIGRYNPNTNPATIELDVDKAVDWLRNGAQPSDTARAILSYKGALMKHHLLKGVDKGAFTVETAEQKFQDWMLSKESKVQGKVEGLASVAAKAAAERMEAETKVKEERAKALDAKRNAELSAAAEAEVAAEEAAEAVVNEAQEASEESPAAETSEENPEA